MTTMAERTGHTFPPNVPLWAERFVVETSTAERKVWVNEYGEQGLDHDVQLDGVAYDVKSIPLGGVHVNGGRRKPTCTVIVVESDYDLHESYAEWSQVARILGVVGPSAWTWGVPHGQPDWQPCWFVHHNSVIVSEVRDERAGADGAGADVADSGDAGDADQQDDDQPDGADLGAGAGWDDLF